MEEGFNNYFIDESMMTKVFATFFSEYYIGHGRAIPFDS